MEGHFRLIKKEKVKENIHREELKILNISALNASAALFIKETLLLLKHTLYHTKIVGDYNTPFNGMNREKQTKERPRESNWSFGPMYIYIGGTN